MNKKYRRPLTVRPRRRIKYGRYIALGIVIVSVILLLWVSLQWVVEVAAWRFIAAQQVSNGVLEDRLALRMVIARDEQLITAPVTGKLLPLVAEGQRVPEGVTIARLLPAAVEPYEPEAIDIKAPFSGQISYLTDGLEKILHPANLENIDYRELEKLVGTSVPAKTEGQVKSGIGIIRLVNNLEPLKLFTIIDVCPQGWQQKKQVVLKVPGQEGELKAHITQIQELEGQKVVIMEVPQWELRWLYPRQAEMEAIINNYKGVIVPLKALSEGPQGEIGVYYLTARCIKWQPVTIVGQVGKQVAVSGLEDGLEVVTNPQLGRLLAEKPIRNSN